MDHVTNSTNHVDGINHQDSLWSVWHTNGDTVAFFHAVIFEGASDFFNLFDEVFIGNFVAIIRDSDVVWPLFSRLHHHIYHGTIWIFNICRNALFFIIFEPWALLIVFFTIFHNNSFALIIS